MCACEAGRVRGRVRERGRVQCVNLLLGLAREPFRNSQPADKWVFPCNYSRRLRRVCGAGYFVCFRASRG